MSEQATQTASPNPSTTVGATQTSTDPGVDNGGGLFQDNPNQPVGVAEPGAAPAATPGAEPAAAGGSTEPTTEPTATGADDDKTSLTRDDIVDILREAGLGAPTAQPSAAAVAEPQITQEQFDKMFNVFKADETLVKRLTSEVPAERIQAITDLRDGLIKQAMTMAEYRVKQHLDHLVSERIIPIQSYVSERQAADFHSEFYEKNPDLKPYELIVDAVSTKLTQKGFTAATRDEVIKRFATGAGAAVKAMTGQPTTATAGGGAGNGAPGGGKPSGKHQMSTLTAGGQGGTSRPGGSGAAEQYKGLPANVAGGLSALD